VDTRAASAAQTRPQACRAARGRVDRTILNKKALPGGQGWLLRWKRSLLGGLNRDGTLVESALDAEFDGAVDQREQGVVFADTDIGAGVELGAALANDDGTRTDGLATVDLHT